MQALLASVRVAVGPQGSTPDASTDIQLQFQVALRGNRFAEHHLHPDGTGMAGWSEAASQRARQRLAEGRSTPFSPVAMGTVPRSVSSPCSDPYLAVFPCSTSGLWRCLGDLADSPDPTPGTGGVTQALITGYQIALQRLCQSDVTSVLARYVGPEFEGPGH